MEWGAATRVVQIRKPCRRYSVASRISLKPRASGGDGAELLGAENESALFVYAPHLHGCSNDGSHAQGDATTRQYALVNEEPRLMAELGEAWGGLRSTEGVLVPLKAASAVLTVHELTVYRTKLVRRESLLAGSPEVTRQGWSVVPARALSSAEQQAALDVDESDGVRHSGERRAVLAALMTLGLQRSSGIADYAYVQLLAEGLTAAGRLEYKPSLADDAGQAPSAVMAGQVASSHSLAAVMVACCRANSIPARLVHLVRRDVTSRNFGGAAHYCEVYIQDAGWCLMYICSALIEPLRPTVALLTSLRASLHASSRLSAPLRTSSRLFAPLLASSHLS